MLAKLDAHFKVDSYPHFEIVPPLEPYHMPLSSDSTPAFISHPDDRMAYPKKLPPNLRTRFHIPEYGLAFSFPPLVRALSLPFNP
jgi:hypothetical protein